MGALCGSPATTAPNGDHLLVGDSKYMNKSPSGVGGSGVFSSSVAGSAGGGASTIASRFFHKHEAFVDKRRRLHEHLPIFDKTNVFAACGTIAPRGTTVERRVLNSLNESFASKRRRLQHSQVTANCVERPVLQSNALNGSVVDTVSPPLRVDVPPSETGPTFTFVERNNVEQRDLQSVINVERRELQSYLPGPLSNSTTVGSNGVSNQCLDSAANVLPDSPPVSTVAALASIANTVACYYSTINDFHTTHGRPPE